MNLKLSKKMVFLIVIGLVLLLFGLVLELNDYGMADKRVSGTRISLELYRGAIKQFKEQKGAYPATLKVAAEFAEQQRLTMSKEICEYITDAEGNSEQYGQLNGNGGWYYDNNTGQVRVNITVPVRKYFKLYFGERRNQIPSEW
jgi:hypothetical protein